MFVSQGSPLFLNAITRFLVAEARQRDLAVRILPGVSAVDVAVAELGIDVGRSGLQTLSAAGFIARSDAVSPRMPLLLLELAGIPGREGSLEAYGTLVDALGDVYPENQPVTLLNTAGPGGSSLLTVTLERFGELLPHIDTSSSLFIDIRRKARAVPAQSRAQADQQAESPA
jgi:precorrin-3B methylase